MKFLYVLCTALASIVVVPFFAYEGLRFYTALDACNQMQFQNRLLLNDRTCFDPIVRYERGEKQDALCKRAELENKISPTSCAWRNMWLDGEVYHVWTMITRSHVMLTVFIVPCFLLTILMCFWSCMSNAQHSKQLQLQERMYTRTLEQLRLATGSGGSGMQEHQPFRLPMTHDFEQRREEGDDGDYIKLLRRAPATSRRSGFPQ
jgi:hypothetical protein